MTIYRKERHMCKSIERLPLIFDSFQSFSAKSFVQVVFLLKLVLTESLITLLQFGAHFKQSDDRLVVAEPHITNRLVAQ